MTTCKHGKVYTCKRIRMLQYLIKKGFVPFIVLPDADNPKYNVWQFKNSVELEACIEEYFNTIRKINN